MGPPYEILAALCLLNRGSKGRDLFQFASRKDQERLNALLGTLPPKGEELLARIQRRESQSRPSVLQEIHPGWILEKLEGESPRILGLMGQFLPGEKLKDLLTLVPPEKKKFLSKINDPVSPEILEIVTRFVEKKFASPPPVPGAVFSFSHIAWMKDNDLRTLFWDLGLNEIRKAFTGVEPQVLRIFLTRFPIALAREIRDRIDSSRKVTTEEKREAQKHLVSLQLDQPLTEEIFHEIGYSVFAQAVSPADLSWTEFVYEKLPPSEGHRLKRILEERVREGTILQEKREEILDRITLLAQKGLIRHYWKKNKGRKG